MHHKLPSYIRTHRRRWALTQKELAHLLGAGGRKQVSRRETRERQPNLQFVIACQVIFGVPPDGMFPELYSEVEEGVMRQVRELYQSLDGSTSKKAQRKRELLNGVLRRAKERTNTTDV